MKRLISTCDRKYYTYMFEIINEISKIYPNYKWLITDIEAYPKNKKYMELLKKDHYLIISTSKLLEILSKEDFQFIWGVFSAFEELLSDKKILSYNLPCVEYNEKIDMDNVAIKQHPLSKIEILVEDASSCLIITDNEYVLSKFKMLFPKCKSNY